jgi:hypothetical protein
MKAAKPSVPSSRIMRTPAGRFELNSRLIVFAMKPLNCPQSLASANSLQSA